SARVRPEHSAILAPDHAPITYRALSAWINQTVRRLRSLGVGRQDRVAVVVPEGPEAVAAIIAVATGAVCVPLYPGFTADEWLRYLRELRAAALVTIPDLDSESRDA